MPGAPSEAPVPIHAQESPLNSSSWAGQVPIFRQENRQSHYRNEPVKYDLNLGNMIVCDNSPHVLTAFEKKMNTNKIIFYKQKI